MRISFCMAALVWLTAVPPQVTTLTARSDGAIVTGPDGRADTVVSITNLTGKAVTAWGIAINVRLAQGGTQHVEVGRDAYLEFAGIVPTDAVAVGHNAIGGRETVNTRVAFRLQDNTATGLAMDPTVTWAIFEDGSWVGDPAAVQRVFRQRQLDKDAYALIVAALRTGYTNGSGQTALSIALERLNDKNQNDYDHADKVVMRRNLEMALRGALKVSPQAFLQHWITKVEGKWTAADEHSRGLFGK
jgi:hypothetical protein